MLVLYLYVLVLVQDMCYVVLDLILCTLFIDECVSWYGNFLMLVEWLVVSDEGLVCFGVALVVGSVFVENVMVVDKWEWELLFVIWYKSKGDISMYSVVWWVLW